MQERGSGFVAALDAMAAENPRVMTGDCIACFAVSWENHFRDLP